MAVVSELFYPREGQGQCRVLFSAWREGRAIMVLDQDGGVQHPPTLDREVSLITGRVNVPDETVPEPLITNAFKVYLYLVGVPSGLTYPSEELLDEDQVTQAMCDVYAFLFHGPRHRVRDAFVPSLAAVALRVLVVAIQLRVGPWLYSSSPVYF
jgi:hypothetical protein